jgi:tRNA 5-methylaminomethyl-2-thiouridine biosynthesis bifunctional protein
VCSEGYIGPAVDDMHCTGATFNLNEESQSLRIEDHQTNLENLRVPLPELAQQWEQLDLNQLAGRVAFRCTLPDYLPLLGPVANETAMLDDFAPLRKNARADINKTGTYLPGLYINIGHGSRGLAYTPLCAELLAAQINNESLPISHELANTLNPARFLIRDLIKNRC